MNLAMHFHPPMGGPQVHLNSKARSMTNLSLGVVMKRLSSILILCACFASVAWGQDQHEALEPV
jgi:hypothetical protein